jgi:hypothetical protein
LQYSTTTEQLKGFATSLNTTVDDGMTIPRHDQMYALQDPQKHEIPLTIKVHRIQSLHHGLGEPLEPTLLICSYVPMVGIHQELMAHHRLRSYEQTTSTLEVSPRKPMYSKSKARFRSSRPTRMQPSMMAAFMRWVILGEFQPAEWIGNS